MTLFFHNSQGDCTSTWQSDTSLNTLLWVKYTVIIHTPHYFSWAFIKEVMQYCRIIKAFWRCRCVRFATKGRTIYCTSKGLHWIM